jgi:hypothetical protein
VVALLPLVIYIIDFFKENIHCMYLYVYFCQTAFCKESCLLNLKLDKKKIATQSSIPKMWVCYFKLLSSFYGHVVSSASSRKKAQWALGTQVWAVRFRVCRDVAAFARV